MKHLALCVALLGCGGGQPDPLTAEDAREALRALVVACDSFPPDAPKELIHVCLALRAAVPPESIAPTPRPGPPVGMGGAMPVGAGGSS